MGLEGEKMATGGRARAPRVSCSEYDRDRAGEARSSCRLEQEFGPERTLRPRRNDIEGRERKRIGGVEKTRGSGRR